MNIFFRNLSVLLLSILLIACSSDRQRGNTNSLSGLMAMYNPQGMKHKRDKNSISKIREMALKETALSLGAQSALAWHAQNINASLNEQARELDTLYDFNALVLENNVLPPVLLEGRNTLNLADTQTIRISNRTYKVAKQARFITTPPHWRNYLWMDFKTPDYPSTLLLPKNDLEKQVWRHFIIQGWDQGIEQAKIILEESTARIKEDYLGMILYRKLLDMNMVSPPYVSHTDLGVTGDASEIHIDDQVLRITALPALNINSAEWKAAVLKTDADLERLHALEEKVRESKLSLDTHVPAWKPVISPINETSGAIHD
ncbi:MAG: type IV secretion system DotC family protein [Legionellaceae bacterium]|nr:type IV secretion system DotC family protein [Legionellaceae bacterium]